MEINSYPSIFNMGHKAIADLLNHPVYVQEKVDGSQFSFGIVDGKLSCRSKGAVIDLEHPEKMFNKAIETVKKLYFSLHEGWVYRCEYLQKPQHNVLPYDRVPNENLILFDVQINIETYLQYDAVVEEGQRLGLEVVPLLYSGMVETVEQFKQLLETQSILGGQKVEGVVIKPIGYDLWGQDKKCLMGKYVSEKYKEIHQGEWKKQNPSPSDIITELGNKYCTPARWQKAVIHLRELGGIADCPQDIPLLINEVRSDLYKECVEQIKEELFNYAMDKIKRASTKGLPEWYKNQLLEKQFGNNK